MSKEESIAQLGQGVSGASRPAEATIPTQLPRDIGHGSAQSAVLDAPLEAPVQQHEMHPTCSVAESECQRGDRSLKEDVLFLVPTSSHTRMAHSTTSNLPSLGDSIEDGHKTQSKSTSENKLISSEDTLDPSFKRLADYLIVSSRCF